MISSFLGILVFMPMEISSEVMWCAKQPDNVHVSYCFAKEKECKSFSILKRKSKQIPISLTKNKYCAVRIPKNLLTLKVISLLARPIVMPSANRFKKLSPINAKMVFDQFLDTNLIIVDDKKCKVGLESTLVNVFKNRLV